MNSSILNTNILDLFKDFIEPFQKTYINPDNSIRAKGIWRSSVYTRWPKFKEIMDKYDFDQYFREIMYCILKNVEYIPACSLCGNPLPLSNFVIGFQKFCSPYCRNSYAGVKAGEAYRNHPKEINFPKLEKYKIEKDKIGSNHFIIKDYSKYGDERIHYGILKKLCSGFGNGTFSKRLNQEIHDTYIPTNDEIYKFWEEFPDFYQKYRYSLTRDFWITYFPKELKIIEYYFDHYIDDDSATLPEKYYFFKNRMTQRPKCHSSGCENDAEFVHNSYNTCYGAYCKEHHGTVHSRSSKEKDLFEYVKTIVLDIICSDRKIIGEELDIYSPSRKIAIEFNGTYFHSYEFTHDKLKHYNKWKKCLDKEIRLITIWEDVWDIDANRVKQFLSNELKQKENCPNIDEIKVISFEEASKITKENSIIDADPKLSYSACYSNNDLVGLVGCVKDNSLNYDIQQIIPVKNITKSSLVQQFDLLFQCNSTYCYLDIDDYLQFKKDLKIVKEEWIEESVVKTTHLDKPRPDNNECYTAGIMKLYFQKSL